MLTEPWVIGLLAVGAILLGIGLPMGLSFPYLFSSILQLQLQLGPGSATFSEWTDSPIPIYMDVYLWNWTNAVEFASDTSIKPAFQEIGPFVFRIKTERRDVQFNDNHTVTFSPSRTYIFEPEMSEDLNTPITALSPVPAVLAYYGRTWTSPFFLALINREVELREQLHTTSSAGNWLFYGIEDSLLDLIVPLREMAELPLPFDKFAWFFGRNQSSTAEGSFTLFTGSDDLEKLGKINMWKGVNRTDAYDGVCGEVGGTTGEVLPPMKNPTTLSVFSADICSQVTLEFKEETEVNGVPGWEFIGSPLAFDDGGRYPEMSCFCTGDCVPAGVRNVSVCKFGAPAFVSFPHFYLADDSFAAQIDGMKPDKSIHEFTLKVEPTTGIPLSVRAQLQINLYMQASQSLDLYKDLPDVYVPMLWFRQHAEITPDLADLVNMILKVPDIGLALCYTVAAIGLIMLLTSCYFISKRSSNHFHESTKF